MQSRNLTISRTLVVVFSGIAYIGGEYALTLTSTPQPGPELCRTVSEMGEITTAKTELVTRSIRRMKEEESHVGGRVIKR